MFLANGLKRLARDSRGVGAVEFVLIIPILLFILGMTVWASQVLSLNRKLNQASRTLLDLAAQQTNIGSTGPGYTYTQILGAASLIVAPFDKSPLTMVLSEVQVTGATSGKVVWSQASSGSALSPGSSVTLPASASNWTGGPTYLLVGTVTYSFKPFGGIVDVTSTTFSQTLYMAPYNSDQVQCCS